MNRILSVSLLFLLIGTVLVACAVWFRMQEKQQEILYPISVEINSRLVCEKYAEDIIVIRDKRTGCMFLAVKGSGLIKFDQ